jgi:hypothetical protein
VAVPNRTFPPPADVVALADVVVTTLGELTPELVTSLVEERPSSDPGR